MSVDIVLRPPILATAFAALVILFANVSSAKPFGSTCTADAECEPVGATGGHCIDGVCCDAAACDGPCLSCNGVDPGSCKPLPKGPSPKCKDTPCETYACDGESAKCIPTLKPSGTPCKSGTCTGGTWQGSTCVVDPAGVKSTCTSGATVECREYACRAEGCAGAPCATNDACAAGFECTASKTCSKRAFRCSDDRRSSLTADDSVTDCQAFLCGDDGRCRTSCSTSIDCAPGSSCEPGSGKCQPSTSADTESEGGCAVGGAPARGPIWFALVAAALAVTGVRARSRCGRHAPPRPPAQ